MAKLTCSEIEEIKQGVHADGALQAVADAAYQQGCADVAAAIAFSLLIKLIIQEVQKLESRLLDTVEITPVPSDTDWWEDK